MAGIPSSHLREKVLGKSSPKTGGEKLLALGAHIAKSPIKGIVGLADIPQGIANIVQTISPTDEEELLKQQIDPLYEIPRKEAVRWDAGYRLNNTIKEMTG